MYADECMKDCKTMIQKIFTFCCKNDKSRGRRERYRLNFFFTPYQPSTIYSCPHHLLLSHAVGRIVCAENTSTRTSFFQIAFENGGETWREDNQNPQTDEKNLELEKHTQSRKTSAHLYGTKPHFPPPLPQSYPSFRKKSIIRSTHLLNPLTYPAQEEILKDNSQSFFNL